MILPATPMAPPIKTICFAVAIVSLSFLMAAAMLVSGPSAMIVSGCGVVTITELAMDLGYLMGSIVIVEEVFAYPGMGRLIIYSVQNRDIPVLQMAVLTGGIVYTVSNFIAHLL